MIEISETPSLITKFRSAHSAGLEAREDLVNRGLTQIGRRRMFLRKARVCLVALYGSGTAVVKKYSQAMREIRNITDEQFDALLAEFGGMLTYLEFTSGQEAANSRSQPSVPPSGKNVFIIHGHDRENALCLQLLLQNNFGLVPIVMMSQAGMSRALLAKFEDSASTCSLAFAVITPDDEIVNHNTRYYQARPNVIFEAGWFVGRLGAPRVCLLLKKGTSIQSDIHGISRIEFQYSVEEKVFDIQKEIEAVGMAGV